MLRRPDFRRWGMVITSKREEAELLLEVRRKKFTTRFTLRLLNPRTNYSGLLMRAWHYPLTGAL
jgi:hypothetical protein